MARPALPATAVLGLFVVSGFAGLVYQSLWSHYLGLVLGHAAYAQSLVLAIFMGGMALGAWGAARLGLRWRRLIGAYALAEAVIGLLYAVLVDKARGEAFAKALIFLPMSISLVGASIIWKFVYEYRPSFRPQIGLMNQILAALGFDTHNFLLGEPWNTLFLIVVLVWIQGGFAMVILSAAIKAIPDDIVEAARLDGVGPLQMFRFVTLPSIRPAVIVVLTTIGIATLKIFDIVRTMTGGQFDTNIVALEFYNQSFRYDNIGLGAALAVILFVLVIPIVVYNVRQLRKAA